VQALPRLLTRSYSGKILAVKRVTENRGKRTPGVDGKIWSTPDAKAKGAHALRHRGYRPQPLRRLYIPKSNGKKRPLGIPTMQDRAMQALWKLELESVAKTRAVQKSHGCRPQRSTADAIAHCFNALAKRGSGIGYLKVTFEAVSTISVTLGGSTTYPWTRSFAATKPVLHQMCPQYRH
jgi:RNA-directed DNA polymerase